MTESNMRYFKNPKTYRFVCSTEKNKERAHSI